ncbi:hypothetical protein [Microbulbifer variabilis]|uniref:hypothetical protein n=1 Tax=Microbulbifer variabilis TaxID=266805 RepID=UPI0003607C81|nr:hypothetical protein [Microbulbifer variabilis]
MSKAILFIIVPLTFLAYLTALGMFESEGGIEKLRKKQGILSRIVFYPLTYEIPEDWTHDNSRILTIPAAIVFFIMSSVGYTQALCTTVSSRVVSTIFAIMCVASIYSAIAL